MLSTHPGAAALSLSPNTGSGRPRTGGASAPGTIGGGGGAANNPARHVALGGGGHRAWHRAGSLQMLVMHARTPACLKWSLLQVNAQF